MKPGRRTPRKATQAWPTRAYLHSAGLDPPLEDDLAIREVDLEAYFAEYPGTFPGLDVTPIVAAAKARHARPDLSDDNFALLVRQALQTVTGRQESMAREVVAYLDAVRPAPPLAGRPGAPRRRESDVRRELEMALARLSEDGDDDPTRLAIASAMGIDDRTLRRHLGQFPSLRDLLRDG